MAFDSEKRVYGRQHLWYVEIEVDGTFHDFGAFVSGVASLPRIVTLHNFSIKPQQGRKLSMKIRAKTYRYKE